MARMTITEQIEKVIDRLKKKEIAKKNELKEIQDELKKYQRSLEPLRDENSSSPRPRPRRKKPDEWKKATDNPMSQM